MDKSNNSTNENPIGWDPRTWGSVGKTSAALIGLFSFLGLVYLFSQGSSSTPKKEKKEEVAPTSSEPTSNGDTVTPENTSDSSDEIWYNRLEAWGKTKWEWFRNKFDALDRNQKIALEVGGVIIVVVIIIIIAWRNRSYKKPKMKKSRKKKTRKSIENLLSTSEKIKETVMEKEVKLANKKINVPEEIGTNPIDFLDDDEFLQSLNRDEE